MTLQTKSSYNQREQNHLPTLKAQAGPWRSYETPGLYFQKERAKVTFGDPLLMMAKGSEAHGPPVVLSRHHRRRNTGVRMTPKALFQQIKAQIEAADRTHLLRMRKENTVPQFWLFRLTCLLCWHGLSHITRVDHTLNFTVNKHILLLAWVRRNFPAFIMFLC